MSKVNRAIELLEQGQPIYYTGAGELSFEAGLEASATWADYLTVEMEHGPFDISKLEVFMQGLLAGGPTRSGHTTPAVIVTLPTDGSCEAVIRSNAWMVKQVLARGVHGILLCHAQTPGAVRAFVESTRYPFAHLGVGKGIGEGQRGSGGQASAAKTWGISVEDYLQRADVWPLNPQGEIMLGLKIEDRRALANAEASLAVPGIAFAEWGPGDMGMSLGFPDRHDPPYPDEMKAAREQVMATCKMLGVPFLDGVTTESVVEKIGAGVMICAGSHGKAAAQIGREHTKRCMPW